MLTAESCLCLRRDGRICLHWGVIFQTDPFNAPPLPVQPGPMTMPEAGAHLRPHSVYVIKRPPGSESAPQAHHVFQPESELPAPDWLDEQGEASPSRPVRVTAAGC